MSAFKTTVVLFFCDALSTQFKYYFWRRNTCFALSITITCKFYQCDISELQHRNIKCHTGEVCWEKNCKGKKVQTVPGLAANCLHRNLFYLSSVLKVEHCPFLLLWLTSDLLASGRNCPNSASRSSCPLNRLATLENTSSSVIPLLPRLPRLSFTSSCSFCRVVGGKWWSEMSIQTYCKTREPSWNSLAWLQMVNISARNTITVSVLKEQTAMEIWNWTIILQLWP